MVYTNPCVVLEKVMELSRAGCFWSLFLCGFLCTGVFWVVSKMKTPKTKTRRPKTYEKKDPLWKRRPLLFFVGNDFVGNEVISINYWWITAVHLEIDQASLPGIPTGRVPTSKHCTDHFFQWNKSHCLKKQCKTRMFSFFFKMLFWYPHEKSKLVKAQHRQYKKHL